MENFSLVKKLINNFMNVLQSVPQIKKEQKYQYAILVINKTNKFYYNNK